MNDRPVPTDHSGQTLAHIGRQGKAASAVAERILMLDRPRFVKEVPDYLDPDYGGLVLCGDNAAARTLELAKSGYSGVLLEDAAAYEKEIATGEAPFALPDGDLLFGGDLDSVLQAQIERGATAALTPTRYVPAGASDALKAIMVAAQAIDRDDVIVVVPISIAWLRRESRAQLTAVLKRIPHPVALALGGQYDPLKAFAAAPEHLRDLLQEVPGVGLWRTDLAGFDVLAHGGFFAAIGAGGSVRHLVPAGERPESSKPFPHYPSVLVPELLRYSAADFLADAYANTTPPRCYCPRCGGTFLDAFYDRTDVIRAAAHAHNAATWNSWLPGLFQHQRLGDRQQWWRNRCKAAVDAHLAENVRIEQPGRFKPPPALKKWADLPLRDTPTAPASSGAEQTTT
ncbi:hypothetical protein OG417_25000 [Actinoallomurus sp. NBC_01490]|uniref:hypothetical protein n=1 Tax=Actinoallomurus sp. NBC_01490 TaxID=2903557 RepID=UPI002E3063C2|nr:hypothetical protein [Actinoallomurus sp. NBC_01490]